MNTLERLTVPFRERAFTYTAYERFLDRLRDERFLVVPMREFDATRDPNRVVVTLRHDIDDRLSSALRLGELEHRRGLRGTYFVLHTAPYYRAWETLVEALRQLADWGHEIGLHNDLVTLAVAQGVDPVAHLHRELARLRAAGIEIVGTASHGSALADELGFVNYQLFREFAEGAPPAVAAVAGKAWLRDFGLVYEAYHVDTDVYVSDATFEGGRRWHTDDLQLEALQPGQRAVVSVHPCHWDTSVATKLWRTAARLGRRALVQRPHARRRTAS